MRHRPLVGTESDRAFDEALFGKFQVVNSNITEWSKGGVQVIAGMDGFAYLNLQFKGALMQAVGIMRDVEGREGIWLAAAPEGKVSLAVY